MAGASRAARRRRRGLDVSDPRPVGTSLQAFVSDPSGNLIELHRANAVPPYDRPEVWKPVRVIAPQSVRFWRNFLMPRSRQYTVHCR